MYTRTRIALKYVQYYLCSSNGHGHGIHSPFVFDFVRNVLNDKRTFREYEVVEDLRRRLLKDHRKMTNEDFGAGLYRGRERSIADVARSSAKSAKYAQFLFRFARYYSPDNIIELGTSLGISAAYLALGNPGANLLTAEGNSAVSVEARKNVTALGLSNVKIFTGEFRQTLPQMLHKLAAPELVFIDGNHRKLPTLDYFSMLKPFLPATSAIIFDDIHYSKEMESAWAEIRNDPGVMLTVDLFFMGIVFYRPAFKVKQHFTIRF